MASKTDLTAKQVYTKIQNERQQATLTGKGMLAVLKKAAFKRRRLSSRGSRCRHPTKSAPAAIID
jgi:hypothetical protein